MRLTRGHAYAAWAAGIVTFGIAAASAPTRTIGDEVVVVRSDSGSAAVRLVSGGKADVALDHQGTIALAFVSPTCQICIEKRREIEGRLADVRADMHGIVDIRTLRPEWSADSTAVLASLHGSWAAIVIPPTIEVRFVPSYAVMVDGRMRYVHAGTLSALQAARLKLALWLDSEFEHDRE